jgi:dihydroflavonol-4-reductase
MRALVTGASGFIGSTLIEELNRLGIEVRALMRSTSLDENLKGLQYEKAIGNLSDSESLKKAVQGVDLVFHLAGVIAAPNESGYFSFNAEGTRRLADAVAQCNPGLKRFVYVSSLAAGGPSNSAGPRCEVDADAPVSAYGRSKKAGELALLKYKDVFPSVILRPPLVYGPKDKAMLMVFQTAAKGLYPKIPTASASGEKYYSSIQVTDLIRGMIQAAMAPLETVPSGEVFYLAHAQFNPYADIMEAVALKLGRKPVTLKIPKWFLASAATAATWYGRATGKMTPFNRDKLNELLPDYWTCSPQKAERLLEFKAEYDLKTGLNHALDWYVRHGWL